MVQEFRELDVRPILRNGGEPFQAIMAAVGALAPGQGLKLFATFRPQPLFGVMESKGFEHEVLELEGGDFEVRFTPKDSGILASEDVQSPETWPDPSVELDLSDLDPPQPMVRLLTELEAMQPGSVLFAVLAREPIFLFPELMKRGHQWVGNYDSSGSAFRIMIRAGRPKE
jgi:TusA-related sulfurtransferase